MTGYLWLRRSFALAVLIAAGVLILRAEEKVDWKTNYQEGMNAFYAGRYSVAVHALETAAEQAKDFPEADRRRVQNKAVLGLAYQFSNQNNRAETLFEEVKDTLHPDDVEERRMLVFALDGLSQIRYFQGRWKEAEGLLAAAMKWCMDTTPSMCRATLLRHLGEIFLTLDRTAEAETNLKQAIDILRAKTPVPESALATTLRSLGSVYMIREQFGLAEPLFDEALALINKLGDTTQPLADTLLGLGRLYRLEKNPARAVPLLAKAVRIYEATHDPILVAALHEQGLISIGEHKFALARQTLERALAISKQVYGDAHVRTAYIQLALAESYLGEKNYSQAAVFVEPALATERALLPEGHVEFARSLVVAAMIDQGRHLASEADSHYRQALDIFRRPGSPNNSERKNVEEGYARFAKGMRK
jgi:tetratricopeptide (TPR) repeat protein